MHIRNTRFFFFLFLVILIGCSKKITPSNSEKTGSTAPIAKKIATPVPKIISVNDQVAKKSADGRLYYDLEGKRYWKNYKNGKYYLFNKTMYSNPEFKPL